ncbi:hypothetical protein IGW_03529 [Bacillus cereus ISP3191]|nr:hypothetical protein IGW_03529 [Bacillus cereus ISP3191]
MVWYIVYKLIVCYWVPHGLRLKYVGKPEIFLHNQLFLVWCMHQLRIIFCILKYDVRMMKGNWFVVYLFFFDVRSDSSFYKKLKSCSYKCMFLYCFNNDL